MKIYLLTFLTAFLVQRSCAQTFDEWFFQKKTQIKYLNQQIVALQAYMAVLEKGYKIVQQGTQAISDIKHGDFTLHSDYFSSLDNVKPSIKAYPRVTDIINLQLSIVTNYHSCNKAVQESGSFTPQEINEVSQTFGNILTESSDLVGNLTNLTTDGKVQLTDAERLSQIDRLYVSMLKLYRFSQAYANSAGTLALQRKQEAFDVSTGQLLYGIK